MTVIIRQILPLSVLQEGRMKGCMIVLSLTASLSFPPTCHLPLSATLTPPVSLELMTDDSMILPRNWKLEGSLKGFGQQVWCVLTLCQVQVIIEQNDIN